LNQLTESRTLPQMDRKAKLLLWQPVKYRSLLSFSVHAGKIPLGLPPGALQRVLAVENAGIDQVIRAILRFGCGMPAPVGCPDAWRHIADGDLLGEIVADCRGAIARLEEPCRTMPADGRQILEDFVAVKLEVLGRLEVLAAGCGRIDAECVAEQFGAS
jgi:hypothetical protein